MYDPTDRTNYDYVDGQVKCIAHRWTELDSQRISYLNRCEQYAEWTLPWLFPSTSQTLSEVLPKTYGGIGARCVNHLANKLVTVMFPADRPFYRGQLGDEAMLSAEAAGLSKEQVDQLLSKVEREGMRTTNIASHRAKSVEVAKHLLVTGNAMPYYYQRDGKLQCYVYTLRNYVVKRMYDGGVLELITRDTKLLGSFSAKAQAAIRSAKGGTKAHPNQQCTLYTYVKWDEAKERYCVRQAADNVELQLDCEVTFPRKLLPWIPLTWNRLDGEDYGRGMVEDYELGFNSHANLSRAMNQMIAIMSDIKRCLDPGSVCDIDDLNDTQPGDYIVAKKDDLWTPDMGKTYDLQAVMGRVQQLEQQLASVFLLSSASTRQAERVTAEEIKMQIAELETSLGGIYSKLANEWQLPLATILLHNAGIGPDLDVTPLIITGMDAMSRTAELEAMYGVLNDIASATAIGPMARHLDEGKLIALACTNRGFDRTKVFKPIEQVQQEDQQRMQMAAQAAEQEQNAAAMDAAMKEM